MRQYPRTSALTDRHFRIQIDTEREADLEDAALIARQAGLDWESIFQEIQTKEDRIGQSFSFAVLDTCDILKERHNIVAPITNQLVSHWLENVLPVSLEAPKTIEDLREELHFPDHQIYNKPRKLEKEGQISIDRSSRLNTYQ